MAFIKNRVTEFEKELCMILAKLTSRPPEDCRTDSAKGHPRRHHSNGVS